jgi:3'-phosphoadenosine 5'-phosphosulfate (PAPS) 3'-phosphatase
LCAWIDPIDCTKGFIGGFVEDSTVLIGISHKGKASIGIVGSPFKYIEEEAVYHPSIFVGSVADQIAYEFSWKGKEGQWKKM